MFGALILGSTAARSRVIKNAAVESQCVLPIRTLEQYPTDVQLIQLLNSIDPDLILLDAAQTERAQGLAATVCSRASKVSIIAIGEPSELKAIQSDPLFSVRVPYPASARQMAQAVDQAIHGNRASVEPTLLSFLPAKAGSGASTVAFQTAASLAARKRRVLLLDTDLHSGVLSLMAGVDPEHPLLSVLRAGEEMDRFRVENAVVRRHGVDMLLTARHALRPDARLPDWDAYFRLLEIVRLRYDDILVDLSEVINPATRELVQRSRATFVVSTPELLSLDLAARRMQALEQREISKERVSLVLNRYGRGDLKREEAEKAAGCPVSFTLPNDYVGLRRALSKGEPVAANTALGRAYHEFAAFIAGSAHVQAASAPSVFRWLFSA